MAGSKYEMGPRVMSSHEALGVMVTIKICNKAAKDVTGLNWSEGDQKWDHCHERRFYLED